MLGLGHRRSKTLEGPWTRNSEWPSKQWVHFVWGPSGPSEPHVHPLSTPLGFAFLWILFLFFVVMIVSLLLLLFLKIYYYYFVGGVVERALLHVCCLFGFCCCCLFF